MGVSHVQNLASEKRTHMIKNIIIITYWSYKEGLIQTYTLPYVKIIRQYQKPENKIFLVTFEKPELRLNKDEYEQTVQSLKFEKIKWIRFNYFTPNLKNSILLFINLMKIIHLLFFSNITHIHTFCTPAGGLGYILSILSGKKLILDSFEPHAESMIENGTWHKNSFRFKILNWLETKQIKRAIHIIGTTRGVHDYAFHRYGYKIPKERFYVKPACINHSLFKPTNKEEQKKKRSELGINNEIVCVYAGKLGGIYHDIKTFELLKVAYDYWEDNFVFLMLTSTPRKTIDNLASKVKLPSKTIISRFVMHEEVASYLSIGDFGITPVKSVPTKRYCTPIKNGEYWALGLPVIITPGISDDSGIIEKNGIGAIIPSLNKEGYLNAIEKIDSLINSDNKRLKNKIRDVAVQYRSFDIAVNIYKKIYYDSK